MVVITCHEQPVHRHSMLLTNSVHPIYSLILYLHPHRTVPLKTPTRHSSSRVAQHQSSNFTAQLSTAHITQHCISACHSTAQHFTSCYITAWPGTAWHSVAHHITHKGIPVRLREDHFRGTSDSDPSATSQQAGQQHYSLWVLPELINGLHTHTLPPVSLMFSQT